MLVGGSAGLTPFQEAVHRVVQSIPRGRVATYGDVAFAVGRPGASRAVGRVMRCNPDTHVTPCHRVVASDGRLGGYRGSWAISAEKVGRLREEGIRVRSDGRIERFKTVRWSPPVARPGSDGR